MDNIFLGLGANLGDRGANLQMALGDLERWGVRVLRCSSIYETVPFLPKTASGVGSGSAGKTDQPDFYNLVVRVQTDRSPEDLLTVIHAIERSLGRVRREKWGPRPIDLDILFYGDLVVGHPELTIPHPHLAERRFVLVPLAEIAPAFVHPVFKKTVEELLKECSDEGKVTVLS
jgi:2-amino-4-hydroxy-6-hydroxymethyldihydropteridine diphosphokinase